MAYTKPQHRMHSRSQGAASEFPRTGEVDVYEIVPIPILPCVIFVVNRAGSESTAPLRYLPARLNIHHGICLPEIRLHPILTQKKYFLTTEAQQVSVVNIAS